MAKVCKRFDSIAEILPDKETVRIQVRVLKLWKVPAFPNLAETSSIEMVLVDEKVGRSMLPLGNNCYVIGLMTGISPEREYVRDGKITKMVVIELTDASGKCDCALFGDYVGKVSVEGKIVNKFDMRPHNQNLELYGKLCRERTKKYTVKNRQIQVIEHDTGANMRPMPGMVSFSVAGPAVSEYLILRFLLIVTVRI
ncbi:Transcription initiation factor IIF, beta subunit [Trifolium repens]|nr:Transcription initiation factor IIF, beta subunit [Trifolium repens]